MHSDLYREMYKFEWEQKTHLVTSVNIPIFGIVTISTVLATIAIGFPYSASCCATIFNTAAVLAFGLVLLALICVFLSLLFVEYKKMPSPVALRNHYKALLEWHLKNGHTEGDAQKDFSDAFDERITKAAEENGRKNRFRGNCIYLAGVFLCCALAPLAVAGSLYVSASISQSDKIHKVQIVAEPKSEVTNVKQDPARR